MKKDGDIIRNLISQITVRKFHDFPITQFLREIKVGESRVSKSAISTHLEALNFDFCEFLHFLKAENDKDEFTQCGKFRIFLSLRFYVKTILLFRSLKNYHFDFFNTSKF